MGLLAVLAAVTTVGAAPMQVDLSAVDPVRSNHPVSRLGAPLCGPGGAEDGRVLAVAVMTYGRRPGRSAWGHTSLRFLACEAGLLRDLEYEYYRMDASIERWFRAAYPGEAWTEDHAYLRSQHGQLVLVRNERPADGGFFAVELARNRKIVGAWMPWSEAVRTALYGELDARHHAQLDRLQRGLPLDGKRYRPMGTNCTLHIREAIAVAEGAPGTLRGSVFPMRNLKWLVSQPGVRLVLHPPRRALPQLLGPARHPLPGEGGAVGGERGAPRNGSEDHLDSALSTSSPVIVQWLLEAQAAASPPPEP